MSAEIATPEGPSPFERIIRHAALAGKLRAFVRKHGAEGLAGLQRLADHHSASATADLKRWLNER